MRALSRNAADLRDLARRGRRRRTPSTRRAHLLAEPAALERAARARTRCRPSDGPRSRRPRPSGRRSARPSSSTIRLRHQSSGDHVGAHAPVVLQEAAVERRARRRRPGDAERHLVGRMDAGLGERRAASTRSSSVGRRRTRCSRPEPQPEERPERAASRRTVRAVHGRADGTLRPWVLSRRWKTSSRSSTRATARPRSR